MNRISEEAEDDLWRDEFFSDDEHYGYEYYDDYDYGYEEDWEYF